jgi:hypothetical protein
MSTEALQLEHIAGPHSANQVIAKLIDGPVDSVVIWSRSKDLLAQCSRSLFVMLRNEGAKFEFYSPSGTDVLLQTINKMVASLPVEGLAMSMLTQGLMILVIESAETMDEDETAALGRIVTAMGISALRVVLITNRAFRPDMTGPSSLTIGKTCHWALDAPSLPEAAPSFSASRLEPTVGAGFDEVLETDSHVARDVQRRPGGVLIALVLLGCTLVLGWWIYSAGYFAQTLKDASNQRNSGPMYFRCVAPGSRDAAEMLQKKLALDVKSQIVPMADGHELYIGPLQVAKGIEAVRSRIWPVGACSITPVTSIELVN